MSRKAEFLMEAFKLLKDLSDQPLPEKTTIEGAYKRCLLFQKVNLHYRIFYEWANNLGRTVYELFFTAKPLPAIVITRELLVQSAVFYCFVQGLEKAIQIKNYSMFERELDRILTGVQPGNEATRESHIRICIDQVNMKFSGFRESYELLLDCVLPSKKCFGFLENGSSLKDIQVESFLSGDESAFEIGTKNLVSCLVILNYSYNKLNALHPRFAEYCEA